MRLKLFAVFLFVKINMFAQTGSWNILNTKLELNEKWSLFGEAQIRSLRFYDDFHYYELKGGATFQFSKIFSITSGIGIFDTYSPGGNFNKPMLNDEVRTWLQLNMTQNEKRLKFEHRYRAEQRWTSDGFRNRFRYRLNITLPLAKNRMESKTFYINASDEIFFTDRPPYFERNRFFLGAGYEFSEFFALLTGWMYQFDYRTTDETGKSFFQLSLLFTLQWRNKTGEKIPGSMN